MASPQVETFSNFVGGQWMESRSGATYPIHNPAPKTEPRGLFQGSIEAADTLTAISAAGEALPSWADTPAPSRAKVLLNALSIFERRADELARTITRKEGKPLPDAMGEVKRAMNIVEYAAGEGRRMFGYTTPSELPNTVAYTIRRPLGVVTIITPWNLPLAIPGPEDRARTDLRQHNSLQARFVDPAHRCEAHGSLRGGRRAPRRDQYGDRRRLIGRKRVRREPERTRHFLYRLDFDRHQYLR